MGAAEEAGSVARTAIEGFKSSPTCLAAIIFAAMMAVLAYFSMQNEEENDAQIRVRMADLLSACYAARKDGDL